MARFIWWLSLPIAIVLYIITIGGLILNLIQGTSWAEFYIYFAIYAAIDLKFVTHMGHEFPDDVEIRIEVKSC